MIIFGTRTRTLKAKNSKTYDCANCQGKGTVEFSFLAKYFHIFWIPIFPLSKKGVSQCSHCKQVLYQNEMTQEMKKDCTSVSATVKRPITHYFGLALVCLFVCVVIFTVYSKSANKNKYLADPKIMDVYEIKNNEGYTLYRIAEIYGDTLVFNPHSKVAERSSGVYDIKKKYKNDFETNKKIKLHKNEVKAMSDKGEIRGIDRN